jgi:hypothetical protein
VERIAFAAGHRVSACGTIVTAPNGRVRALWPDTAGYSCFTLTTSFGRRPCAVHRLQAYQKFGEEIYTDGLEVRHLDNLNTNNKESNIALGTKSQNAMDKTPETRLRCAFNASRVVLKHDYVAVRAFYAATRSYKKTMAEFGISSKGTLNYILKSKPDSAEVAA